LLILKKPLDNIEVLQLASALTEKWRLAEVAQRRVQDLETLVERRTRDLERSNARLAAANKQLALQPQRANELYYGRAMSPAGP
jgi:C4-dicarboxylate-specific signal transduction histidine kinase